jgi:hypothetical protein
MPLGGLVATGKDGLRFGVWLMPDNKSSGSLESFLQYLVPAASSKVWDFAKSSTHNAKVNAAAPYRAAHLDKANIHTWLSWQDPPGESFGIAITRHILNPQCPEAKTFATWFCDLFQLAEKPQPAVLETS